MLCIATPDQITGNAYYCPADDGIVYDTGVLVPVLLDHYGTAGLTASLAHEFGHAVAARLGAPDRPLFRELQADCLAGAALAALVPADEQIAALAPLLDFADQPERDSGRRPPRTGWPSTGRRARCSASAVAPPACRDLGPDDLAGRAGPVRARPATGPRGQVPAGRPSSDDRPRAGRVGWVTPRWPRPAGWPPPPGTTPPAAAPSAAGWPTGSAAVGPDASAADRPTRTRR